MTPAMSRKRHALVGDPVIAGCCGPLLQREPVEPGRVEPVHRGPAIQPFAHVDRKALFTREVDQDGTKPWSPSPWTDGGRRTTDTRTPRAASEAAASSEATRGIAVEVGISSSVRGGPA